MNFNYNGTIFAVNVVRIRTHIEEIAFMNDHEDSLGFGNLILTEEIQSYVDQENLYGAFKFTKNTLTFISL